ncbi:amino acid ABC transporter permease [Phreatobacter stygius]|uniref:Amino acid ABC transporter permease n=1 Tax=Phreatobacter stygius TaxID=1940610 RepID=A0A4D7B0C1_9HYPH|nr:amino acid ABC transporter permease [Phreatobacter stygius]QCI67104.1 amino acid ABC transporter permease [Phreatobacter stygius]
MGFDWAFFWERLTNPGDLYLLAIGKTIVMAVLAMLLGLVIGVLVGFGRLSRFRPVAWACGFYVWLIRGIPVLVLLVFFFSGLAAAGFFRFADLTVGGLTISASFQAAVIGLGIHEGAYMAEIVRNGIQAVARGQIEAAKSLGMGTLQVTRRIILPQATRVIVPPLGNDFNHILKTTSLASVIGVQEIFQLTESMSATTFKTFELLIVLSITYLVLTTVWNFVQGVIETKLRAHELDEPVTTWTQSAAFYLRAGATPATDRR